MDTEKKGYESESGFPDEGDVFAAEVKAWFMDGAKAMVGAIVALVLIFAASFLIQGCGGGGSGNGSPIYEGGDCVNCGNGDASVMPEDGIIYTPGDSCNGDTCAPTPQYDTTIGACEAIKAGKKPPEVCTPQVYKGAKCSKFDGACEKGGEAYCFEYDDDGVCTDGDVPCYIASQGNPSLQCVSDKADCADGNTSGICAHYPIIKECASNNDCSVPCDAWPPEVCWGLPCLLVGKWDCDGYINDLTDAEFYDNGDEYCRIHSPADPNDDLYYKPGDDHVQRPPSGEPVEEKYTVLDGGSQLKGDGSAGTFNCTKLVEE